jgi:hypothetical protein
VDRSTHDTFGKRPCGGLSQTPLRRSSQTPLRFQQFGMLDRKDPRQTTKSEMAFFLAEPVTEITLAFAMEIQVRLTKEADMTKAVASSNPANTPKSGERKKDFICFRESKSVPGE